MYCAVSSPSESGCETLDVVEMMVIGMAVKVILHEVTLGWSIGGFTIDYRDATGDSWDLALAPSGWQ